MATILKNIVRFTGLAIGVPVALPHRLNVNGIAVAPKTVEPNIGGFTITATTTNVTVTRTADAASGNVDVLVEFWHSIEAVVPLVPPPGQLAGLVPWVQQPGAGGGGGGGDISAHNVLSYDIDSAGVGPVQFNDWTALYAQLVLLRAQNNGTGIYTIVFYGTEGPTEIPAGTWDMDRTEWISRNFFTDPQLPGSPIVVSFTDGTIITNLTSITGLRIENFSTTPGDGIIVGSQTLSLYGATLSRPVIASGPAVTVIGSEGTIRMADESALLSNGAAVLVSNGTGLILNMDGANTFVFDTSIESEGGGGTMNVNINAASARYSLTTFAGAMGINQNVSCWWRENGGDPNGLVGSRLGNLYVDNLTGDIWKNIDDTTGWILWSAGSATISQPSWIATIDAVSIDPSTPTQWVQFTTPDGGNWQPGDVITIDFQIHVAGASMSLFLAQGGTLIPTSPVTNGTSANPWTGRMTFAVVAPAEGRTWGAMSTDDGGLNIETNVPSPPASFSFTGSDPIQLMILSDVEATPLIGTLEARLSRGATITDVT